MFLFVGTKLDPRDMLLKRLYLLARDRFSGFMCLQHHLFRSICLMLHYILLYLMISREAPQTFLCFQIILLGMWVITLYFRLLTSGYRQVGIDLYTHIYLSESYDSYVYAGYT